MAAVRSGTPVLIEGGVGRGKTKVSLEIARALGRPFFRVDGAPDVTVQKIVGWFDPSLVLMEAEEAKNRGIKPGFSWDTFIPGPLTEAMKESGILFVNEGTRLPSDTWNALLTAMDERIVVIPKLGVVEAKPGFSVIVTANPMEHAGAYPLPEAASDRFVWVPMERQDPSEEREIIRRELLAKGYEAMAARVEVLDIIEACVDQTYNHPDLVTGVSVRAGVQMGCILAELGGDPRDENTILQAALMAFQKKLKLRDNVTKTREQIIAEVVDAVFHGSSMEGSGRRPGPSNPPLKGGETATPREGMISRRRSGIRGEGPIRKASAHRPFEGGREVRVLRSLSRERPERAAGQLNSDPEYVKEVQGADPEVFLEVFHRVRPWLHEKVYDLILHTYTDSVLREAEEIYITGRKAPIVMRVDYEPGRGVVDWEETIDKYIETAVMDRDTIVVKEPLRTRRSLVLMMDHSGSMTGRKILTAALCTGVLSYALKDEEFAVLLFNNEVCTLKEMNALKDPYRLIREILNQPPKGFTDIRGALETGLKQMEKASYKNRMGVLITDGIHTTGDPIPVAERYPILHVMGVPSKRGKAINAENCKRMAEAGKGRFLLLRRCEDIPLTILKTLA